MVQSWALTNVYWAQPDFLVCLIRRRSCIFFAIIFVPQSSHKREKSLALK